MVSAFLDNSKKLIFLSVTDSYKCCCWSSWGQFHQHLTQAFCVDILAPKILNSKQSFVIFGAEISHKKRGLKMLMKLTLDLMNHRIIVDNIRLRRRCNPLDGITDKILRRSLNLLQHQHLRKFLRKKPFFSFQ